VPSPEEARQIVAELPEQTVEPPPERVRDAEAPAENKPATPADASEEAPEETGPDDTEQEASQDNPADTDPGARRVKNWPGLKAPSYPRRAVRKGAEGDVEIAFDVLPSGETANVEILEHSGWPSLDEAAREAVENARLKPAKRGGIKVRVRLVKTFRFRLKTRRR
jgi:protein TonB